MSTLVVISIFPLCMIVAAAYDVATMTIPNWLSIVLVATFPLFVLAHGMPAAAAGAHAAVGAAALALGFGLFAAGYVGGGDAKLLAATSLWVGWHAYLPYVFFTGLIGGALALAVLFVRQFPLPVRLASQPWIARLHTPGGGIPYGVALAAGGLAVFADMEVFRLMAS